MFSTHTDNEKKQWIIEDRNGHVFAQRAWPESGDAEETVESFEELRRFVQFANTGVATIKRAKEEVVKLQSLLDDLG